MAFTRSTVSRKTIAIAVAAGMSLTGVSVATSQTTDSGFGAAVAHAQDAKPGVSTSDVSYLGIFNKDNTKLTAPFTSAHYARVHGPKGTVLDVKDGSELRADFSLANANPGDTLRVTPHTEFELPNGDPVKSSLAGVRVSASSEWRNVEHEGTIIGKYRYVKSGSLEVEFNDAVADVKSGKVTLSAPVMVWDFYTTADKNGVDAGEWDGDGFSTPVTTTTDVLAQAKPKGGDNSTKKIGAIGTANFSVITSTSTKGRTRVYDPTALVVDTENFTVRRTASTVDLPAGANGTIEVTPDVDNPKGADWYFADNLTFTPRISVYGEEGSDEAFDTTSLTYEEAQKKFPGLKVTATKAGRGIKVTTAGVPENVKVRVSVRGGEGETGNSYGTYVENASMYYGGTFKGTVNGEEKTIPVSNTIGVMVPIPGLPSVSGLENVKRTGELSGAIASQPAGVGVTDKPAPVGGTKQTFQFFVKNTGDAPMAAPIVTLPNDKKVAVKNVAIKPGGTGSFSVDYDVPAGSGALPFNVSLSKAELSPSNTVTFRYIDKSEDTKDKLIKDLEKERKRVDDLTKRTEQAEKALEDAKGRISQLEKDNKAQQKQIDEAKAKIDDLNKEVADLNKELDAAKKRVSDLEKQNAEQEKKLADLAKKDAQQDKEIERLTKENKDQAKKIADLKTDLDKTKKRVTTLEIELAKTQADLDAALKRIGVLEENDSAWAKCYAGIGAAGVPMLMALPLALMSDLNIPGLDHLNVQIQRTIGVYNPEAAKWMNENRGLFKAATGVLTAAGVMGMLIHTAKECLPYNKTKGVQDNMNPIIEGSSKIAEKVESGSSKDEDGAEDKGSSVNAGSSTDDAADEGSSANNAEDK